MIKKIKCLFVGTLVVFSVPGLAFADEGSDSEQVVAVPTLYDETTTAVDNTLTPEDIKVDEKLEDMPSNIKEKRDGERRPELRDGDREDKKPMMKSNLGSKIRYEGLSSNIIIQAKSAQVIIAKLETMDTEVSIDELNLISTKFDDLLKKLESLDFENLDQENLKLEMDLIKDSGKEITKEFKDLVSGVLTDEDKAEIRDELKAIKKEVKEERKESLEELKKEMLIEKTVDFLNRLDVDSSDLVLKIESGELSTKEIKDEIRNLIKSVKIDKFNKIKEDKRKSDIEHKDKLEKSKKDYEDRKKKFDEEMREKHDKLKEKYDSDKEKIMKEISDDRINYKQKVDEMRDKYKNFQVSPEVLEALKETNPELAEKFLSEELSRDERKELMDSLSEEELELIKKIMRGIER